MNVIEQVNEALRAVKVEVDRVLSTGPLVTGKDAFAVGTLLRLTGRTLLDAQEALERAAPPPHSETLELF